MRLGISRGVGIRTRKEQSYPIFSICREDSLPPPLHMTRTINDHKESIGYANVEGFLEAVYDELSEGRYHRGKDAHIYRVHLDRSLTEGISAPCP